VDAEMQTGIPAPHFCGTEEAADTLQEHYKEPPGHSDKGDKEEKAEQCLTTRLKRNFFL
jgi:hypothetical protein